jgi:hypothetical protein
MKRLWMILALTLAAFSVAAAAEMKYPKEVEAQFEYARQECKDAEGTKITVGPGAVRKIELSGDKRDDYVVDMREIDCEGGKAVYCGTAGCNLVILVAKPDGSYVTVFDQRAHQYTIMPGTGPRRLKFHLHGGYCGGPGAQLCIKSHRITAKPFEFRDR